MASYWPGGAENPHKDRWGWIFAFANLVRFRARAEQLPSVRGLHDGVVLAVLSEEPEPVTLSTGSVRVYPKSLHTLLHILAHDRLLDWLNGRLYVLQRTGEVSDLGMIERTTRLIFRHQSLIAWIATTPGSGMPYDPDREDAPEELPAEYREWAPEDFVRVLTTFLKVHQGRFESLRLSLAPPSGGTSGDRPLSWARWISSLGIELKTDPVHLIKDQSFVKLLAMARLHGADTDDRERERAAAAARDRVRS